MHVERKTRAWAKARARYILRWVLTAALTGVIVFCGVEIWNITAQYRQEAALHAELMAYSPHRSGQVSPRPNDMPADLIDLGGNVKAESGDMAPPSPPARQSDLAPATNPQQAAVVNQSILDLREINADVVGWIHISGTEIDYPFVQAADNNRYLGRDLRGKYAATGTVFMDYRNNPEFANANTMLYGHHMRNGSMFGTLSRFDRQDFFNEHTGGMIYLDYNTFELEIFAYMVVTSGNAMIYDTHSMDIESQTEYFTYVKENARRYRDIGLTPGDRIATLSTCAYEFNDARMVVLARLKARR